MYLVSSLTHLLEDVFEEVDVVDGDSSWGVCVHTSEKRGDARLPLEGGGVRDSESIRKIQVRPVGVALREDLGVDHLGHLLVDVMVFLEVGSRRPKSHHILTYHIKQGIDEALVAEEITESSDVVIIPSMESGISPLEELQVLGTRNVLVHIETASIKQNKDDTRTLLSITQTVTPGDRVQSVDPLQNWGDRQYSGSTVFPEQYALARSKLSGPAI